MQQPKSDLVLFIYKAEGQVSGVVVVHVDDLLVT